MFTRATPLSLDKGNRLPSTAAKIKKGLAHEYTKPISFYHTNIIT